jgi:hypothetical protein
MKNTNSTVGNYNVLDFKNQGDMFTGKFAFKNTSHSATVGSADFGLWLANGAPQTEVFTVLSSGNVGIGTTTPATTLSVVGTTTSSNLILSGLSTNTSGNAVCIVGTTVVTAGNTTCITSSKRFKQDITPLTTWKSLLDIDVVQFNYKPEYADNVRDAGGKRLGFIAEQVNEVDPQLVQFDQDGNPLSVHFDGVMALTVQAVQDLQSQIDGITGKAQKSAQDNWQWGLIALLFLLVGMQQYQISKLKK